MIIGHHVEQISAEDTIPLRSRILRPFQPIESCRFDKDLDACTFHLGLFHAGHIVSVGTFIYQSHPNLHAGHPYRLRGMATHEAYRGRGFGLELLRYGVEKIKQRRGDLLWFNAREKAIKFYQKAGFLVEGDLFMMEHTGPHKLMYKHLILR